MIIEFDCRTFKLNVDLHLWEEVKIVNRVKFQIVSIEEFEKYRSVGND